MGVFVALLILGIAAIIANEFFDDPEEDPFDDWRFLFR